MHGKASCHALACVWDLRSILRCWNLPAGPPVETQWYQHWANPQRAASALPSLLLQTACSHLVIDCSSYRILAVTWSFAGSGCLSGQPAPFPLPPLFLLSPPLAPSLLVVAVGPLGQHMAPGNSVFTLQLLFFSRGLVLLTFFF